VSRYLAAASAYEGMDFRQAFEVNRRARVVMVAKDNQEVTQDIIDKEKRQAYIAVTRLYRGMPTQLARRPVLTFNKDLAYLEGKIEGMKFLERAGDDVDETRRIFLANSTPTIAVKTNLPLLTPAR
jgi:hypothetical protein